MERLRERGGIAECERDVAALLLDEERRDAHIAEVATAAVGALDSADAVICTSRLLVTSADADDALAISRRVSAALVEAVRQVNAIRRSAFVVAEGVGSG